MKTENENANQTHPQTLITPHIEIGYWFRRSLCVYSFPSFMNSCLFTLLHISEPFKIEFSGKFVPLGMLTC